MNQDGIVLLAKQPGLTSFSSLHSIKKALGTNKVGHTGTLDSFAQGLLVVCTGRLTRLAGNITEFDKSYKAVIKFGEETDTLEYTGQAIKSADLPSLESLKKAISAHTGTLMQKPPAFSAIHIDGKRASDLARNGKVAVIPSRQIQVFSANLIETKANVSGNIEYALIDFSVSKGTYIRSLARDIGEYCGSAAHLIGLYRTKVGNFNIEDAAGYNSMQNFTIDAAIAQMEAQKAIIAAKFEGKREKTKYIPDEAELALQKEIVSKLKGFSLETSVLCGFDSINLISKEAESSFMNGQPLRSKNFSKSLHELNNSSVISVFTVDNNFAGLIEKNSEGKIRYKFVNN